MRLGWRRRAVYGLVTTVLFMGVLEVGARAYSALRYGNPAAPAYGRSFAARLLAGAAQLDAGWGAGRGGDAAAASRDAAEGVATDRLFVRRVVKDDGLAVRPPRVETFNSGIPASFNSFGFRGSEISPDPPHGTVRIAAFGGSYVFGAYLRDDQTWPNLLQEELRGRGASVEVVNAGNSGANVHGVLEDMIRISNRARLDFALVTSGYNNHPLLPIERRYSWARATDFYLYNLSLAYVMFKERAAKFIGQPLDYGMYRQRIEVRDRDVEWLVDLYARRLRQMATLCQERGIRLVLASQPEVFFETSLNTQSSQSPETLEAIRRRIQSGGALSIAELEFYLQGRLNSQVRQSAEDLSVGFFDGESVLLADKHRYFVDQIHPNERGAERMATALADYFEPGVRQAQVP